MSELLSVSSLKLIAQSLLRLTTASARRCQMVVLPMAPAPAFAFTLVAEGDGPDPVTSGPGMASVVAVR